VLAGFSFTSAKERWGTPPELVAAIAARHGVTFGVDAAADADWKVAPTYIGPDREDARFRDVLSLDATGWRAVVRAFPGAIWMNPPYTRHHTRRFVEAAANGAEWTGRPAIVLIFARTDTRFWHDVVWPRASWVDFLRGRVIFNDPDTRLPAVDKDGRPTGAPAPSAVIRFDPTWTGPKVCRTWTWRNAATEDAE